MAKGFSKGNTEGKQFSKDYQPEHVKKETKRILAEYMNREETPQRLYQIFIGYKGVKASESLQAFYAIAAYADGWGKPKESIEVEQKNPFQNLDNVALIAMAERLTLAVKGGSVENAQKAIENGSLRTPETSST